MSKITLNNLNNLQNENTAVSTINANNDALEAAIDNTVSRDGSGPNQMNANLDMNSNRILNLPAPLNASEPATYGQLTAVVSGAAGLPIGGSPGQVLSKTGVADYVTGWANQSSLLSAGANISIVGNNPTVISSIPNPVSTTQVFTGSTSGTTTLKANAVASGVVTLPAATDTLIGKATTDTLTNKTLDTAGTGNSLLINGVAVTANTGTGAIVRAVSPAITTPTGIVKADVGLSNVDNTSDVTKNSAAVTLTNKTIDTSGGNAIKINGNTLAATAGTATVSVPNSTDTLVGRNTVDTLTNKSIVATQLTGTVPAAQMPAHTGEVTSSAGTVGLTITNSAVTNAKLANVAAWTFKGNATGSSAAPSDVDIGALTTKASPLGTDEVMIRDNAASGAWKRSPVSALGGGGSGVTTLNGQTGGLVSYYPPQGRITLTSGSPVMATSVAGATTVYYTPSGGNIVPIYDGTNMVPTVFPEVSQTTTDTTKSPAAVAATKVYDLFAWNDSGTPRVTRGPAWTNSSTRGYTFTVVNGIALNTSSVTNGPAASRGTWVGTIASNASSTIDYIFGFATSGGGAAVLNVWNAYNKVATVSNVVDTGAVYTYSTATTRQARGSAGNQISFVVGDQSNSLQFTYGTEVDPAALAASTQIGVGFDTTTAFSGPGRAFVKNPASGDFIFYSMTSGGWLPAAGTHVLSANERGDGAVANFFNNSSLATLSTTIWN